MVESAAQQARCIALGFGIAIGASAHAPRRRQHLRRASCERLAIAGAGGGAAEQESAAMSERDPMLQLASLLLPEDERRGVEALYTWCRRADEVCDAPEPPRSPAERIELLQGIEDDFRGLSGGGVPSNPIDSDLQWVMQRWPSMGDRPFEDMLAGMRAELEQTRFSTFDPELRHYSYCVAGTVGLMLLPLLGITKPSAETEACAVDLGVAIQLTNILRDVGYDVGLGRMYLPQDELTRFGVKEADVLALRMTPAYRELICFQVERARGFLRSSRAGVPSLPRKYQLMVLAVIQLMGALLDEVVACGCDNLTGKVRVNTVGKATSVLAALWEWLWMSSA